MQTNDLHARATRLAHDAMVAAASMPHEPGISDYARTQADYEQRRLALREEGIARSREHNLNLHIQSQIRKHGGYQQPLPF